MQKPPLTIGIVFYNEAQRIADCLNSLTPLDVLFNLEYIFVDNGSSDDTAELVDRVLESKQKQIILNKSNNMARARNLIVSSSFSPVVYFIDADCRLDVESVQAFQKAYKSIIDGQYAAVGGANRLVSGQGSLVEFEFLQRHPLGHMHSPQMMLEGDSREVQNLSSCNLLVSKQAVEAVGGFDEILSWVGEDLHLTLRLRRKALLNFNPQLLVHHQQSEKLSCWFRKMIKYGFAQPVVSLLLLPRLSVVRSALVLFVALGAALAIYFWWWALVALGLYFIVIASITRKFRVTLTLFVTHLGYGLGILLGLMYLPIALLKMTVKKKRAHPRIS